MTPGVVVINWNGGDDLVTCLAALRAQTLETHDVLVVDNASSDDSLAKLFQRYSDVRVHQLEHNVGYGRAANAAFAEVTGDPVVILNPDVVLRTDWLEAVTSAFSEHTDLGIAGSKLLYPDERTVQHAGGLIRPPLMLADHRHYGEVDADNERDPLDVEYVTGAAMAIRRSAFERAGGFDPGYFMYYEEVDLCRRVRDAGYAVRYLPRAVAVHHESAAAGRESATYYRFYHHSRLRYALKWLTPTQFLVDFVPAERARLSSVVSVDELTALRHAFADHAALLCAPGEPTLAAAGPELRPALADALADLAARAIVTVPTGLPRRGDGSTSEPRSLLEQIVGRVTAPGPELREGLARIEAHLEELERRLDVQATWLIEMDREAIALARRVAALGGTDRVSDGS